MSDKQERRKRQERQERHTRQQPSPLLRQHTAHPGEVLWVPGRGYHSVDAVEAACDRDRAYFAANPEEEWYVRASVPGEYPGDWPFVLVRAWGPGVRTRTVLSAAAADQLRVCRAAGVEVFFPENEVTRRLAEMSRRRAAAADSSITITQDEEENE